MLASRPARIGVLLLSILIVRPVSAIAHQPNADRRDPTNDKSARAGIAPPRRYVATDR